MCVGNSKAQREVKARGDLRTVRLSTCSSAHTQPGLWEEKKDLTNLRCLNIHNLCPGQWLSTQPADAETSRGRQRKKLGRDISAYTPLKGYRFCLFIENS